MNGRPDPLELLPQAAYVISRSIVAASTASPASPTPCTEWDLGTLVRHVADSAATLAELIEGAQRAERPIGGCAQARRELQRLVEVARGASRENPVIDIAAVAGTFEFTIHAWDINQATGRTAIMPADLVRTLLVLSPVVLGHGQRSGLFADEVPVPAACTETDRLLALFGRRGETS